MAAPDCLPGPRTALPLMLMQSICIPDKLERLYRPACGIYAHLQLTVQGMEPIKIGGGGTFGDAEFDAEEENQEV